MLLLAVICDGVAWIVISVECELLYVQCISVLYSSLQLSLTALLEYIHLFSRNKAHYASGITLQPIKFIYFALQHAYNNCDRILENLPFGHKHIFAKTQLKI